MSTSTSVSLDHQVGLDTQHVPKISKASQAGSSKLHEYCM